MLLMIEPVASVRKQKPMVISGEIATSAGATLQATDTASLRRRPRDLARVVARLRLASALPAHDSRRYSAPSGSCG